MEVQINLLPKKEKASKKRGSKMKLLPINEKNPSYFFNKAIKIPTNCLFTLKFISAFIVAFVVHYPHFPLNNGFPFANIFKWSRRSGNKVVELFFMLSGFGMFLGYNDNICKHEISFKVYIMKRIKKLYPLFFFTLILVTILEIWHLHLTGKTFIYPNFDCWHFFMNLILCQDGILGTEWSFNSPSWCISICFILYIIHFAVMYFSKEKTNALYIYIILMFFGLTIKSMKFNYPFLLNDLFGRGLSCFSIGVILANIFLNSHKLNTNLIGYICLIILVLYYNIFLSRYNDKIGNEYFIFIMVVSPSVIFSVLYVSWINKLLSMKPMLFLGSLSVKIYLLHFNIQCFIRNMDLYYNFKLDYSLKKTWLLYCCSTIIVSAIYHHILEKGINFLLSLLAMAFIKS